MSFYLHPMIHQSIKSLITYSLLGAAISLIGCTQADEKTTPSTDQKSQATTGSSVSNSPALTQNGQQDSTDTASELTTTHHPNPDANDTDINIDTINPEDLIRPEVSQQFVGVSPTEIRLAFALPELPYEVTDLPDTAIAVNQATWVEGMPLDEAIIIKIQALLNYHHHSIGAVDGQFGRNVIKAMQVFQQKHGLEVTETMNLATWNQLTSDEKITQQPILVNYTLTQEDVYLPRHYRRQQYQTVTEAVAEKFHMSQGLLTRLNPNTKLRAGAKIIVYNPYQPNITPVHRVVAIKDKNILLAYDIEDKLVASYPTTVGSRYKPSPSGTHKVINRVINPSYNKDFSNKNSVLPPGPNNPVGRVWIGISKPGYGIHGSPNPEKISQQNSSGCVRLTNWDALGLFGTIEKDAIVEFE